MTSLDSPLTGKHSTRFTLGLATSKVKRESRSSKDTQSTLVFGYLIN